MLGSLDRKQKNTLVRYIPLLGFLGLVTYSSLVGYGPGIALGHNFLRIVKEIIIFLPFVFLFIGVLEFWIPREIVERNIGHQSGIKGMFLVILLAMSQAGPLYVAFPVTHLLASKGCSNRNIFIYLGAFSTLKFPMVSFEIGFIGLKFSLLRIVFTLPVFIMIGILLDKVMGSSYSVLPPAEVPSKKVIPLRHNKPQ